MGLSEPRKSRLVLFFLSFIFFLKKKSNENISAAIDPTHKLTLFSQNNS